MRAGSQRCGKNLVTVGGRRRVRYQERDCFPRILCIEMRAREASRV